MSSRPCKKPLMISPSPVTLDSIHSIKARLEDVEGDALPLAIDIQPVPAQPSHAKESRMDRFVIDLSRLTTWVKLIEEKPSDPEGLTVRVAVLEDNVCPTLSSRISEITTVSLVAAEDRSNSLDKATAELLADFRQHVGDFLVLKKRVDVDMAHCIFHDFNYLWSQLKFIKDEHHPNWRALTGYRELTVGDLTGTGSIANVVAVHHRMMTELPVSHMPNSLLNHGSLQVAPLIAYPTPAERESIPDTPSRAFQDMPAGAPTSVGLFLVQTKDTIDLSMSEPNSPREGEAAAGPSLSAPTPSIAEARIQAFLDKHKEDTPDTPALVVNHRISARFSAQQRTEYGDNVNSRIGATKTLKPRVPNEPAYRRAPKKSAKPTEPPVAGVIRSSVPQNLLIDDDIGRMLRAYDEQDAASSGAAFSSLDGSNTFAILETYRTDSPEFVPDNQRDLSTDSELVEQFQAELVALTGEPVDISLYSPDGGTTVCPHAPAEDGPAVVALAGEFPSMTSKPGTSTYTAALRGRDASLG